MSGLTRRDVRTVRMFCFASACGGSVEDVAESWEVWLVASVGVQEVSGTETLLLSVVEAAAVLSVSRTTLYELMWRDEIKPIHIGRSVRIAHAELVRFVDAQMKRK